MADPGFEFKRMEDLLSRLQRDVVDLRQNNAPARAWVPRLVGWVTQPTNTGVSVGTYTRSGDWVTARFQFRLAGWSLAAGSGILVDTPWVPDSPYGNVVAGQWWAQDANTGAFTGGMLLSSANGTTKTSSWWFMTPDGQFGFDATTPWTWADNDYISGVLSFQADRGY